MHVDEFVGGGRVWWLEGLNALLRGCCVAAARCRRALTDLRLPASHLTQRSEGPLAYSSYGTFAATLAFARALCPLGSDRLSS